MSRLTTQLTVTIAGLRGPGLSSADLSTIEGAVTAVTEGLEEVQAAAVEAKSVVLAPASYGVPLGDPVNAGTAVQGAAATYRYQTPVKYDFTGDTFEIWNAGTTGLQARLFMGDENGDEVAAGPGYSGAKLLTLDAGYNAAPIPDFSGSAGQYWCLYAQTNVLAADTTKKSTMGGYWSRTGNHTTDITTVSNNGFLHMLRFNVIEKVVRGDEYAVSLRAAPTAVSTSYGAEIEHVDNGSSLSAGNHGETPPSLLRADYYGIDRANVRNVAVGGRTVAQMLAAAPAELYPQLDAAFATGRIVVLHVDSGVIYNTVNNNSSSSAGTAAADISAAFSALIAGFTNWKTAYPSLVIDLSDLPNVFGSAYWTPQHYTAFQATFQTTAMNSGVVDYTTRISTVPETQDNTNATFWNPDRVHPMTALNELYVPVFVASLNAYYWRAMANQLGIVVDAVPALVSDQLAGLGVVYEVSSFAEAISTVPVGRTFTLLAGTTDNPTTSDIRYLRRDAAPGYALTADQPISKNALAAPTGAASIGTPKGTTAGQDLSREIESVSAIVADASLSYAAGPAQIGAGSVVRARKENYSYTAVASAETDYDIITAGGVKLRVAPPEGGVTPHMISPLAGSGASDTAYIQKALLAARRSGVPLHIDRDYLFTATATTDPIRLQNNDHVRFTRRAAIVHGTYGVPVFWNLSAGDKIILENPTIRSGYTITPGLVALGTSFRTYVQAMPNAVAFPDRNQYWSLLMMGTDLTITGRGEFIATDFSDATKFLYGSIGLGYGLRIGGVLYNSKLNADVLYHDGYVWGPCAWSYDELRIEALHGERYTMLDPAIHTAEQPAHLIYCTGQGSTLVEYNPTLDTYVGSIVDNAIGVGISNYGVNANNTAKFTMRHGAVTVGSIFSKRRSGFLDIGSVTTGYQIGPVTIGKCTWDGRAALPGDYTTNKVFRLGVQGTGNTGIEHANVGPMTILLPPDDNDYCQVYGNDIDADITFVSTGTIARTNPFTLGSHSNSKLKIRLQNTNARASTNWIVTRIDGGYGNNFYEIETDSPDWLTCRPILEANKASQGNVAVLRHTPSNGRREVMQGCDRRFLNTVTTLAPTGPTVDIAAAVPKGATLLGVQSLVTTAITGATGYQIGTATDPDLFGVSSGVGYGAGTNDSSWTANGGGYQLADVAIRLTATGADFATGSVNVSVQYSFAVRYADTA